MPCNGLFGSSLLVVLAVFLLSEEGLHPLTLMKTIFLIKTFCLLVANLHLLPVAFDLSVARFRLPSSLPNLCILNNSARMEFRIGGENLSSGVIDSANGVVSTSAWTHVVGTFDGTIQRLYINGVKVAQLTLTSAQIANFQPNKWGQLCIGRTSFLYGGNRFFTGLVDEVAVYASLLSDNTVKAHYDAASTNNVGYHAQILAANPVGYWPFEEPAYTFPNTNTYPIAAGSGTIASPGADLTNTL